jgi:riboflavin kinase / FMN adenylyltransferase
MRVLHHYRDIPAEAKGAVIALGNFDGVHRGHRALIAQARLVAETLRRPLAVAVFEPYPREFFRPQDEPFRLTPFPEKTRLLESLAADFTIVLPFDAALAGMEAQDFVLGVLKEGLAASHVVVGREFRFGKGRGGDAAVLAYMGEMENFGVTIFDPVPAGGFAKISSSDIRAALKEGRPEEAARLLGRWWSIEGEVVRGDARGRTLGFPTANVHLDERILRPAFGVYAVRAAIAGETQAYGAAANFGVRPMFEAAAPLLEVHLFDFSQDLYGKRLTVEFVAYLRPEEKFANLEALKAQMEADCTHARRFLAARSGDPASARPASH